MWLQVPVLTGTLRGGSNSCPTVLWGNAVFPADVGVSKKSVLFGHSFQVMIGVVVSNSKGGGDFTARCKAKRSEWFNMSNVGVEPIAESGARDGVAIKRDSSCSSKVNGP